MTPDLSSITSWNDQVIAAGSGDLRIRNERGGWESYGLYGALPDTLDDAFVVQAGANDDLLGVAMIVDGPGPQSTGSSLLTKDGFVLRYDALGFALTVTTPEGRDIGFAPWQQTLPDGVMLSATDGLTVVDRDSGDEVTFTFAEMAELDQVMAAGFRGSQAVVLLTADGGTWAAGVTGPDAIVSQLLPMGKHMLAVMAWMEWSGHGAEVRATRLARVGLG